MDGLIDISTEGAMEVVVHATTNGAIDVTILEVGGKKSDIPCNLAKGEAEAKSNIIWTD